MANPILVTPGQTVAGPEWEALAAQHGGVKSSQKIEPTAEQKSAANKAASAAAPLADGEEADPNDPRTWYIRYETNPSYRYYFADGTYVEARTAPNGADYAVVDYKPSPKFTSSQTPQATSAQAEPPKEKEEGGRRYIWQPNPGGPAAGGKWVDVGPASKPTSETKREPVPGKPGFTKVTVADATKGTSETYYEDASGNRVQLPEYPEESATVVQRNGKTYIQHTVKKPNGGGVDIYFADQSGARVTLPDDKESTPPPAETGSFIPDRTKPAMGLVEHVQRLAQLRAQGKLTDKQYNEAISTAEAMAAAEGKRLDAQISAQQTAASQAITQRGQDISASTARLGQANAATREAFDQGTKWASAMTPASYKAAGGPLYSAVMVAQDARAGGWGGMYQPPQVTTAGYPAWDSLVRADPNPSGAYVASQNAAITGQANQLIQGAATPPPPAAPAAPLPAPLIRPNAPVVSPPPTAGEPGGPPLAPGPVYGDPPPGSIVPPGTPNPGPVPGQDPNVWTPPNVPIFTPKPPNYGGWNEPTPPPPAGAPTWDTYRPPPISSPAGGNVQLAPFTAPAFGAMDPRISRVMGNVPQGMDPSEWANYVMEAARLEGVA